MVIVNIVLWEVVIFIVFDVWYLIVLEFVVCKFDIVKILLLFENWWCEFVFIGFLFLYYVIVGVGILVLIYWNCIVELMLFVEFWGCLVMFGIIEM